MSDSGKAKNKTKTIHPHPPQKRKGIEFRQQQKIQINKDDFLKSIVTKPNDKKLILKNLNITKITYNEIIFFLAISSLYLFVFFSIKENHHI